MREKIGGVYWNNWDHSDLILLFEWLKISASSRYAISNLIYCWS